MGTLFGCMKKKTSGQVPKVLTVRQCWMLANFQFLSAHLCILMKHSQLGRVQTPALLSVLEGDVEGGDADDDAISVISSPAPCQLPTSAQATASLPSCDGGPPRQHLVGREWTTPFKSWLNI